jgi:hypothetical protein
VTTPVHFEMDVPVSEALTERETSMLVRLILAFFKAPAGNVPVVSNINAKGEQQVVVDLLNTSVTH